ncbi:MAG: S46 family peptidase [Alistipes sp.]|nr:S46 family peptidase [Alistipes sp.]
MKRLSLIVLLAFASWLPAAADEGMWLPSLIAQRIDDMRAKGFQLTAEDIYSINRASLKDAVVLFDDGCTGELVSAEGLLITNHHCGYDAIQRLSSLEHDYLTDGFWAATRADELPSDGLNVKFLKRMEDITDRLAAGESRERIIEQAAEEGRYKASIEQMYYGNQQFLFVYEQFDDVRLVGTPPSSIGKFGGDTDNWVWPRHTGDFSIFRIYADKENRPAAYSPENVPYRPAQHFKISTRGIAEGDFTMIYGFPGNTQEYIISDAVDYIVRRSDPAKIRIRTERLDRIARAQEQDPAMRIMYASIHAGIANAWKKWQGEALGLERKHTLETKRAYEEAFEQWAADRPEYRDVVRDLKAEYARIADAYFALELMNETVRAGELNRVYRRSDFGERLYPQVAALNRDLFRILYREYYDNCPGQYMIPRFAAEVERLGSPEAYADLMFEATHREDDATQAPELEALRADVKRTVERILGVLGRCSTRNLNSERLNELYTVYIRGLREWDRERAFYPDANLTLRVAYGKVAGYHYADGIYHKPVTTIEGILAKDNPEIYDYDIPQTLRRIIAEKDYGRWGVEIDGRTTVPVCFLADNHTTGGNSGSPVLNARGELIGVNFDRTWLSTMSDVAFDPAFCRNIALDIRYVLFVIDRIGDASYLFDEMEFAR